MRPSRIKKQAVSGALPPAKNEIYYVSINEDPPGYFIVCHGQYDPYNARPESAPAVCEISMISFNPSTTYGNGVLRRSRKPQFEDLCALQLLAQPYAGNAHVEARLFVHTPCCRVARVSAVETGLRARVRLRTSRSRHCSAPEYTHHTVTRRSVHGPSDRKPGVLLRHGR